MPRRLAGTSRTRTPGSLPARPPRDRRTPGGDVLNGARRGWILAAVGALVSVAAAYIAIRGIDLDRTWQLIARSDLRFLALAIGVIAVQVAIRSARWRLLLPVAPGRRPAVARVIPVLLIGYLGNAILPARLGEAVRAALLARRERISATETLGSVILERIIDTVTLAGFALTVALLVGLSSQVATIGALAIAAGIVAIVGITLAPRILARIRIAPVERIVEGVRGVVRGAQVADRPRTVAAAFGISLVAWVLDAAIFLLAGRALGIEIPLHGAIVISAVAALSTAVPSAPGFIGTLELAISTVAQAFGVEPAASLALAIVVHAVALIPVSLAGVVAAVVVGRDGSLADLRTSIDADRRAVTSL